MTVASTVSEVLGDHITMVTEGIDRLYLNLYVPILQISEGAAHFWIRHRANRFASSCLFVPTTKNFVDSIERYADSRGIELPCFGKGQPKVKPAKERLSRFDKPQGVLFIGKAQENASVPRTTPRRNPVTGQSCPWLVPPSALVNYYCFYCVDRDFGAFFLKFCSYFP